MRQQIEEAFTWRTSARLSQVKAAVPDILKYLSMKESSVLLSIHNSRWLSCWCPMYVVLFLKRRKDPADMVRYHTKTLTSTIGKVLERLITNCLPWWLEEHLVLSSWQVGFHKGRSTTDQCLSQFTPGELQLTQRRHTIATFLDFSRTYDRVWRTGLLMQMLMMDVHCRFTERISCRFIHLTARVRVNGNIGHSRNKS